MSISIDELSSETCVSYWGYIIQYWPRGKGDGVSLHREHNNCLALKQTYRVCTKYGIYFMVSYRSRSNSL